MLLIEEKQVPINIELVPMRSYGDKPVEFMRMVPGGMLPAITVERDNGQKQVITESGVIMELLDQWHPESEGYKPMLPKEDDQEGWNRYNRLARLERELFSWWCTLMFRPEGPKMPSASSGFMGFFSGMNGKGGGSEMISGSMSGFLDCLSKVDQELSSTPGPWFFDRDYPTMIDFVYVSHVERMLASCAYWKGLHLRDEEMKKKYPRLNNWLDAFDKRECFLAFKSDYYTHVKDIPPQYGPSYNGGFEENRKKFSKMIDGTDGKSWVLPLPFDDPIQPLYKGPPLPLCALKAAGIEGDANGSYEKCDPNLMAQACRQMAGWKLSSNGQNVAKFAARGGSAGSKNPRKSFGAELADPYAESDVSVIPHVDNVLRVVCEGLLGEENTEQGHMAYLKSLEDKVRSVVPSDKKKDVISSLAYLRDRVGVPRDLPLASARQLRAHLNWAISSL
jgi:glutathione S-transferase